MTVTSFQVYPRLLRNPNEFNKYSFKIRLIKLAVMQFNFIFAVRKKQLLSMIDSLITLKRILGLLVEHLRVKRFGY